MARKCTFRNIAERWNKGGFPRGKNAVNVKKTQREKPKYQKKKIENDPENTKEKYRK